MELTKQQKEMYALIIKDGTMKQMFDFAVMVGRLDILKEVSGK